MHLICYEIVNHILYNERNNNGCIESNKTIDVVRIRNEYDRSSKISKTAGQNLLPETTPDFDTWSGIIGRKLVDGQKKKPF